MLFSIGNLTLVHHVLLAVQGVLLEICAVLRKRGSHLHEGGAQSKPKVVNVRVQGCRKTENIAVIRFVALH